MSKGIKQREAEQWARICASPEYFRNNLIIDAGGAARRFGDVVERWQSRDFAAIDPAWLYATGRGSRPNIRRAWLERPRGHSKTGDIAMSATWALTTSAKRLSGVVAAADRDQAGFIRDAIARLLNLNDWLNDYIDAGRERIVNKITGSELVILTSDVSSSYGHTADFVICDEVTHWAKRDLWDSLFSTAGKKDNCLLLAIQNAGFQDSWQWLLRESLRTDPRAWYFCALDGPQASWISAETLAEQRHLLPQIAYARLWLNRWSLSSGDALTDSDLREAITLAGPPGGPEIGWSYSAGLDLGVSKDASALVVVGRHIGHWQPRKPTERPALNLLQRLGMVDAPGYDEPQADWMPGSGRTKLVACEVWQPSPGQRVSLEEVRIAALGLHKIFNFSLGYDPSQAILMAEQLQAAGVPALPMPFVAENLKGMCQVVLDSFTEKALDLYDNPRLLADLRALRVAEKNYGVRLTSPRGVNGHGDAATALSIALLMAKRHAGQVFNRTINRPLLCAGVAPV